MNLSLQRKILKACRYRLKEEIDEVTPLIKSLKGAAILSGYEVSAIHARTTRSDQGQLLLDIMDTKGTPAYPVFRTALGKYYPQLAEALDLQAAQFIAQQYGVEIPGSTGSSNSGGLNSVDILCSAIRKGHHGAVRELLSAHVGFARPSHAHSGLTPLETACRYNRETSALLLHERGAAVTSSCILLAATHGSAECMTFALTHMGAAGVKGRGVHRIGDVTEAVDRDGWTALHHACSAGHASITRLLLDAPPSASSLCPSRDLLSMVTYLGDTALHLAVKRGDPAGVGCVRAILQHPMMLKNTSNSSLSDFINARTGGAEDRLDTALHMACNHASTDPCITVLIRLLLQHGADINAQNRLLATPLHEALRSGRVERVEALLLGDDDLNDGSVYVADDLQEGKEAEEPVEASLILTDEEGISCGQLIDRLDEGSEMRAACELYKTRKEAREKAKSNKEKKEISEM